MLIFKGHDLWTFRLRRAFLLWKTINVKDYHVCGRFYHIVAQINSFNLIKRSCFLFCFFCSVLLKKNPGLVGPSCNLTGRVQPFVLFTKHTE